VKLQRPDSQRGLRLAPVEVHTGFIVVAVQPIPDSRALGFSVPLVFREATCMTSAQIAVIVVIVVALIAAVVMVVLRNRTKKLRAQFGPEYDRAVAETGNRLKAEAELERVEKRVKCYPLRPLTAADRDRFQQSWRAIQAMFVDDPARAFMEADRLLGTVMLTRGYPPTDFENRAAEISVDHAAVVEHYRAGHEIALRHAQCLASTEDLRKGMVHYRALFDELMEEEPVPLRARTVGRG
jgi:hypothetical protein